MNNPSIVGFIGLLFVLTLIYVLFMGPLAAGSYYAFKSGTYQQYSDGLIGGLKKKLKIF